MRKMLYALVIALVFAAPLAAHASQLTVASYSMYNGDDGSYNYRDFTYAPCDGVCDITGSFLNGGTGKLTDGVSPTLSWYQYGWWTPWVGWYPGAPNALNPTITFNFPNTVTINSVTAWLDNTPGFGDVRLPASVSIGGTDFQIAPDDAWGPRLYTFSGLNIAGNSVSVQFFERPAYWIMVGEVSFNGTQATPLPPALLFLGSGLVGLAAVMRRFKI